MEQLTSPERYRPFASLEWRNFLQQDVEVPALVRALGVPQGRRMLEVGCGRGVALGTFARLCSPTRLVGLDVDRAALAQARDRLATRSVSAELVCSDVRSLPFADGSFDVVVDFGTCYHISRAAQALAEIARVLGHGGLFVHETRVAQLLAHPVRSLGNRLPWSSAPTLVPHRARLLWASRRRGAEH